MMDENSAIQLCKVHDHIKMHDCMVETEWMVASPRCFMCNLAPETFAKLQLRQAEFMVDPDSASHLSGHRRL